MGIGLYIHIPFCKSKCFYCDFNSYSGQEHLFAQYLEAVKHEILFYCIGKYKNTFLSPPALLRKAKRLGLRKSPMTGDKSHRRRRFSCKDSLESIDTIYIGGGTPSILGTEQLVDLMLFLFRHLHMHQEIEITMEANPGTIDKEKLQKLKTIGINRLSIGLQSFDDDILQRLGRFHSVGDFLQTYTWAREVGFNNINIDLIFAVPGQTLRGWQKTLIKSVHLNPEHLSLYNLTIEPETKFGQELKENKLQPASQEQEAEMYQWAIKYLTDAGFEHYEISNFALPGKRCQHNIIYWQNKPYLGVGAGASSYLEGVRIKNIEESSLYIAQILKNNTLAISEREILPTSKRISETIMLNLRMLEGVNKKELQYGFNQDIDKIFGSTIRSLKNNGLLQEEEGFLKLTAQGLMLANQVFQEFLS